MAAADDALILKVGVTKYYFSPGDVEEIGQRYEENQAVGVAEDGTVKVALIAAADVRYIEFRVNSMPAASRTYNTLTVQGWTGLLAILRALRMRAYTFGLKMAGVTDTSGNYLTVRYWDSVIPETAEGASYTGKLTFRVEAA